MSDLNNALVRLESAIGYALEDLDGAVREAETCCDETADGRGNDGWTEMAALAVRFQEIRTQLAAAVPESIAAAMKDAGAYLDEMSDMADAASY